MDFKEFFQNAVGYEPFPFQVTFAQKLPQLVNIPTGLGKTAMAVVGWLWRRFAACEEKKATTPRRLIYCLPMRVLVEQTRNKTKEWIDKLHNAGLTPSVPIYVLMGGEDEEDWDVYPEREAIIIGTQDMLLSRALNRGYAASRFRWPMQFGLLNNDCLWVFDEIQLMGAGLATTAQLEAFRRILGSKDGHGCLSVWMSATMQPEWLKTVDFQDALKGLTCLKLSEEDENNNILKRRYKAPKKLEKANADFGNVESLVEEIRQKHKPGTRTLVVVNTVKRACKLFKRLSAETGKGKKKSASAPSELVLLHSRFRPPDREEHVKRALADIPAGGPGMIIVSTQVIEAGVDLDAATLFTELAPWASLVQRFGRCNRRGRLEDARVFWIDVPEKEAAPYDENLLVKAREILEGFGEVSPEALEKNREALSFEHEHVIRRKDIIELFDTTPDLAGNDIDIDRFVREVEDSDVRVFWRDYGDPKKDTPNTPKRSKKETLAGPDGIADEKSDRPEPRPRRDELCPAPIDEFRNFAGEHKDMVWRWDFLDNKWVEVDPNKIAPGQLFMVHRNAGGYSRERGWDPSSKAPVEPIPLVGGAPDETPEATDDDRMSRAKVWQTIAEHTGKVTEELNNIVAALPLSPEQKEALHLAALWHDRGKAHEVFQRVLPDGNPDPQKLWAKAPGKWKEYERKHFRHELASALAVLMAPESLISKDLRDLVAYLVAAHHGKVRLSIRSLPGEQRPAPQDGRERRFARGIWDGDELPEVEMGNGQTAPKVRLSLEPMELGLCQEPPFEDQPSWIERMLRLRDKLGPFRLAYFEALLRAADWRASMAVMDGSPSAVS